MKLKNVLIVYTKPKTNIEKLTINLVKNCIKKHGINYEISDREELNNELYLNKDIIVVIGGDGTFLRASHFIFNNTPVIGVNSNPEFKEGFFMVTNKLKFVNDFNKILTGKCKIKKFQRLEAYINGKKIKELALNEFYIASVKDYHTARYFLYVRGIKERQKSSGVLISTPAGSYAWIKSAGGKVLPLYSNKFEYLVREPYCGKISAKCSMINGILNNNEKIEIIFEVGRGLLIADSLSTEHKFKAGERVTVKMSEHPLNAISFSDNNSKSYKN